jgi:two-component system alkaline phosphatase synthesis response regulator PhoP
MPQQTVLVVEDDQDIRQLIVHHLSREGFRLTEAAEGEAGLKMARSGGMELILLDLMLPGISGMEICRSLKADAHTAGIPVIMVTAKGSEADIVAGLEMGADDYLVKPFSPKVLVARVKSVLRRRQTTAFDHDKPVRVENLEIHAGRHQALVDGKPISLTLTEFQILHLLASKPGWVFTRYQIVDQVKGGDYPVTDRAVDVQIVGLRKKLGACGKFIETVRGVGYRFADPAFADET